MCLWLAKWRVSPNKSVLHAFPTYFTIHLTSSQTQLPGLDKVLPVQTLPVLQVTEGLLAPTNERQLRRFC